ncbi:MAG: YibE/F family protein [Clostridiales bacterium]|nr:YibE/F family protein [Clostridiales bacterium]
MSKKMNLIFVLVAALLTVGMMLLPDASPNSEATGIPREKVRVVAVDNSMLDPLGIVYSGVQQCQAEILTGPHKGEIVPAANFLNSDLEKDKLYREGDRAVAMVHHRGEVLSITLVDLDRMPTMGWIFVGYMVLLVVFAGLSGVRALVSLLASAVMMWKVYIPLLLWGAPPIPSALLMVLVLTCIIDFSVAGFTKLAVSAIIGSLLGTLVTLLLSLLFSQMLRLDGTTLPFLVPLLSQTSLQLDIRSVYLAMTFIGASGALTDLGMDIAASCNEVQVHAPSISGRELRRAGISVGKTVIGTMTTTLVMAYSGNFLTMLMYYQGQGTPLIDIFSYRFVAAELMSVLVGAFGLLGVAPLTAWVCGWLFPRWKGGTHVLPEA